MSPNVPRGIHSPRLHVIMYGLLLVATPFVLLQSFLVEKISEISGTIVNIGTADLPVLPLVAAVALAVMLICCRRKLTWLRLIACVLVLLMNALAQQITDYYFDHNFYDLQQNWHYLAYALFAYMVYRDLTPRGVPPARIILITYATALTLSTFDEIFQMHMSSRVFDVSDIAKDVWGTLMGILFIYLITNSFESLKEQWRILRHRRVYNYLTHPPSLLVLITAFGAMFVIFASLLTDYEYCHWAVLLTIGGLFVFFVILHLSQRMAFRAIFITMAIGVIGLQGYAYVAHRDDGITFWADGLTVYNGIPILFFDVMIFADGGFRLVDKKHYFNNRDQEFFKRQPADILLISSGSQGNGGHGFPKEEPVQFIYNQHWQQPTQVIILENEEACRLFNRLKKEGKRVLFILHNTC